MKKAVSVLPSESVVSGSAAVPETSTGPSLDTAAEPTTLRESLRSEFADRAPRRRGRPSKEDALAREADEARTVAVMDAAGKLASALSAAFGASASGVPPEREAWAAVEAFGRLVAAKWLGRLDFPYVEEVGLGVSFGTYLLARKKAAKAASGPGPGPKGEWENSAVALATFRPPANTTVPVHSPTGFVSPFGGDRPGA